MPGGVLRRNGSQIEWSTYSVRIHHGFSTYSVRIQYVFISKGEGDQGEFWGWHHWERKGWCLTGLNSINR